MPPTTRVPKTIVTLENGSHETVDAFSISREPVSIEEISAFCREAGYKTTAERANAKETYAEHRTLREVQRMIKRNPTEAERLLGRTFKDQRDIAQIEATFVSYDDATAYCEWTQTRLPTETEWLAASVLNWEDRFEDLLTAINQYTREPRAIKHIGAEWTSTTGTFVKLKAGNRRSTNPFFTGVIASGQWAVLRSGPVYVLGKEWHVEEFATIAPTDFFHSTICFRVCGR